MKLKSSEFPLGKVQSRGESGARQPKSLPVSADQAQILAIEVLGFLAADPERLEPFLSLTGLTPDNMRKIAGNPEFLGAVLDHLASNEPLLLAFCEAGQHNPLTVMQARQCFGGLPTWDST